MSARSRKRQLALAAASVTDQAYYTDTTGLAGADKVSREMASWLADPRPIDRIINPDKEFVDARSRDVLRNNGHAQSAATLTQDSIVGSQFKLNARPNIVVLSGSAAPGESWTAWEEEFQEVVEARFNLLADSDMKWFDAMRVKTFTDIIRSSVLQYVGVGEVVGTSEWLRSAERPFSTAFNMINPDRLCNPDDSEDTENIRKGVVRSAFGDPQAYWFRTKHKYNGYYNSEQYKWDRVEAYLPWGRPQVLHIYDQRDPDQSRGVAAIVAVLKEMRMTSKYQDTVLQNAVTQAIYAAAIESELPAEVVASQMGGNARFNDTVMGGFLGSVADYHCKGNGLKLDGVKIPVLHPNTKLKFYPAGQIGDTQYLPSLLRHLAASFGVSYEEFARDFTQTNYSSARAAFSMSWRHMTAKKRKCADATARFIYGNVLEEWVNAGDVPLPPGFTKRDFYAPMMREAFTQSTWIGAPRGQIDELKETDAAIARLKANLSTWEDEIAKLGGDWRALFRQIARERKLMATLGIEDVVAAMLKSGAVGAPQQQSSPENNSVAGKQQN